MSVTLTSSLLSEVGMVQSKILEEYLTAGKSIDY